jgi:hypothetical protein
MIIEASNKFHSRMLLLRLESICFTNISSDQNTVIRFNRSTASRTPPLLKPIRFIIAESSLIEIIAFRFSCPWCQSTYFDKTKTKI